MSLKSDKVSAAAFFKAVYQHCRGGFIEFRFLPSKERIFHPLDYLDGLPPFPSDQNSYFGVGSRDGKGGGKENLIQVPALWADWDLKTTTEEEMRTRMKEFQLTPSFVTHTGGGYHLFWLLREPVGSDGFGRVEDTLKRLATHLGADPAATDVSRILRVPWTLNLKHDPPPKVRILKFEPSLQYSLSDFDYLPQVGRVGESKETTGTSEGWEKELLEGVPQGQRNQSAARLAGRLLAKGLSEREALIFLSGWNRRNNPPLAEREIETILASISKAHQKNHPEKPKAHGFRLISAQRLLKEPEENTQWVWEGILPQGGMSLLVAKPKVGKSTLALNLAVAVSRGEDFLGRPTIRGPVVYLALEEKRGEIRKRLMAMEVEDEPIHLHFGLAPKGAIDQIDLLLAETGAVLLVVDTLQKLARVKDLNDYATVTTTLEPLLALARERNCHILLTHHAGKTERTDGDDILGSTALLGSVDTAILLKKREQGRTMSTVQRYGDDVPETVILLTDTFTLTVAGSLEDARKETVWAEIRMVLETYPRLTEAEIFEAVNRRKAEIASALRWALSKGLIARDGTGKKGDPYRYKMVTPLTPVYMREVAEVENFLKLSAQNQNTNSHSQAFKGEEMPGVSNSNWGSEEKSIHEDSTLGLYRGEI